MSTQMKMPKEDHHGSTEKLTKRTEASMTELLNQRLMEEVVLAQSQLLDLASASMTISSAPCVFSLPIE